MDVLTPAQVVAEQNRLMAEAQKGIQALYKAEIAVAEADLAYERELALSFVNSDGSVADRQAVAKLQAGEKKLALDFAKAELNRVKAKLRANDSAQVAVSVIARQVENEFRRG
jgi:hypothetical protein